MGDGALGASRGAGALLGIVGTFLFPGLLRCCGALPRAGSVAIWLQWFTLSPVAICLLLQEYGGLPDTLGGARVTAVAMVVCVVLSRPWLWCFDLAEAQALQEYVHDGARGTVSAVQTAVCQLFTLLVSLQGLVFHDPAQVSLLLATDLLY